MQQYRCDTCGELRKIPEEPTTAPQTIRIGCPLCQTIRTHFAVGKARWALKAQTEYNR